MTHTHTYIYIIKKVRRNFQTLNSMLSNISIRDETKEEWINKNELLEVNRTKNKNEDQNPESFPE